MKKRVFYESPQSEIVELNFQGILCNSPLSSQNENYGILGDGSWEQEEDLL